MRRRPGFARPGVHHQRHVDSATAGSAAPSITARTRATVSSTASSATSNSSSSCTCSSIRAGRPSIAAGTRIIARRMMSAAEPWIGALIACALGRSRRAGRGR